MLLFYLSLIDDPESKCKVELIYTEYFSYMSFCANAVAENEADVEDAVHNAMIKIIGIVDDIDFSDMEKVKTLCGIIARNEAINICKLKDNQTLELSETDVQTSDEDTPEDTVISEETCEMIVKAINVLDDVFKDALSLKYYFDYKEKEIAEILGVPIMTVGTRIYRAKRILRKMLEEKINV